ncbi:MAG: HAMP domain-containing protein [Chloroflexi bacterium]|nr:HAMP domain-containing protein [Chloroflexota bacterium]
MAVALYGNLFARDILSAHAVERSANQVHLQAESLVSSLRQAQGDAFYLTVLRSLRMLRQQAQADQVALWRNEVAQDFMVLLAVRPMYRALRYVNAAGMEVVSVETNGETVSSAAALLDRREEAYFQATANLPASGVYVSPFVQEENERGVPTVHYAINMPDHSGVIVIDLHAGWLLRNLPAQLEGDIWALVDQSGRHLVYPENFDPGTITDDLSPMLGGGMGSFETSHSVYVYDTIVPTASNPGQFWVLYRETPKTMLYAELNSFYLAAGGFSLLGLALAALLALLLSRHLVKPITQLEYMTAAFGREGVPPPLPENLPQDEIGSLTRTFCVMARELERKRKQEHQLLERLIRAQEEERKLIAYDLHDGLIQQLVGARFHLTNFREQQSITPEDARKGLMRGCEALTEAIVEGRRIIEGLRPAVLDDLGLRAALEDLAQSTAQAAGWELTLELQPLPTEPETSVGVTLFRITQEALNNARKHAHAQHVSIHLYNGVGIGLVVEDDGVGFDSVALANEAHGLGVRTMQERAALLGGTCVIQSTPQQGTKIEVWVPNVPQIPNSGFAPLAALNGAAPVGEESA